jgi:hypothetical protein
MSTISKFDAIYRNILLSKFFSKGWGHPENMKKYFIFIFIYLSFYLIILFEKNF